MARKTRTIYLLRHAVGVLSAHHKGSLARLEQYLFHHPIYPEIVFCSKAKSARQTCKELRSCFPAARIVYHDYLALDSEYALLDLLNVVDDEIYRLMLLGHEMSLTNLLRLMVVEKKPAERIMLTPATLVKISLPADNGWSHCGVKQGTLREIFCP